MVTVSEKKELLIETYAQKVDVVLDSTSYQSDSISLIEKYVSLQQEEEGIRIAYPIPERMFSFFEYANQLTSRVEKLRLAEGVVTSVLNLQSYEIPYLHPDNLYTDGTHVKMLHKGFSGLVFPMEASGEQVLQDVQALVLSIFHRKLAFNGFKKGLLALEDAFSKSVMGVHSLPALRTLLQAERVKEQAKVADTKFWVDKKRYRFYRMTGIVSLLVMTIVLGFFYVYYKGYQKQEAIIEAQASFMTKNYAQTQSHLQDYAPTDLPKSAKYIVAVSSIYLADLTETQKEAILNHLSLKSDNNSLDYWIYTGRGSFEKALDLAQNLGDSQLILFAYTNLYQATKLDTKMDGAKKQELLEEYTKKIEELTTQLTGSEEGQ